MKDYTKEYVELNHRYLEAMWKFKTLKRSGKYDIEELLDLHAEYIIAGTELRKFKEKYMQFVVIER